MRFAYDGIDAELQWTETQLINELVIESPALLRKVLHDLSNPDDAMSAHFTFDGKELKLEKDVDVIYNPLRLDFNNRKAIATLLKILVKASLSEDFYLQTNTFKTKVVKYLHQIIDSENFIFEVSADDFTMDSIAKAINLHIVDDEDDFVELLTEYMSAMVELAGIKLFVFLNLRPLLSDEELSRLIKNLHNHQLSILLLEGYALSPVKGIKRILIDQDLCEL